MLSFIAQFNKQDGPNGAHQYQLKLDIDEAHRAGFLPITQKYTKGDTFLVTMIPIDSENFTKFGEAINETKEITKKRFRNQMYVLIKEVAKERNISENDIKTELKKKLKQQKYLEKSTSELEIDGFSAAIYLLQNDFSNRYEN